MVFPIITILALLTSNAVICMDNNNNNLKEEQSYNSDDEVKINGGITNEKNYEYLKPKKRASLPDNFTTYTVAKQHYTEFYGSDSDEDSKLTAAITTGINNLGMKQEEPEQSFTPEELKKELENKASHISTSPKAQEAAQKFKDLMASKYGVSRAKKAPSQASTDFIKMEENGMENDGQ